MWGVVVDRSWLGRWIDKWKEELVGGVDAEPPPLPDARVTPLYAVLLLSCEKNTYRASLIRRKPIMCVKDLTNQTYPPYRKLNDAY